MIPIIVGESLHLRVRFEGSKDYPESNVSTDDEGSQNNRVSCVGSRLIRKIYSDSLLCNSFFSLAESLRRTDQEKRDVIVMRQESLDENSHLVLCVAIKKLHPKIAAPVLRYSEEKVWERVLSERESFSLIQEVINNAWPKVAKVDFLSKIFQRSSFDDKSELLYYFMLHAPFDLQDRFLNTAPSALIESLQELQRDVEREGKFFLQLYERDRLMELPSKKYARMFFLTWLQKHAFFHRKVCLLTITLKNDDLKYLKSIDSDFFISLISPWTRDLALFVSYHAAKSFLEASVGLLSAQELVLFLDTLGEQELSDYIPVFQETTQKKVIKYLSEYQSEKFNAWILHLSNEQDFEMTSKVLSVFFSHIQIIFHPAIIDGFFKLEPIQSMKVFSCLSMKDKEYILRDSFRRAVGMPMLSKWIHLSLFFSSKSEVMLKKQFSQNLSFLLNKIGSKIVPILKKQILKDYPSSTIEEKRALINLLFPSDQAFEDKMVEGFEALAKLDRQENGEEMESLLTSYTVELLDFYHIRSPFTLTSILQKFIESKPPALLKPLLHMLFLYHADQKLWSKDQWRLALELALDSSAIDKGAFLVSCLFTQPRVLNLEESVVERFLWSVVGKTLERDVAHNRQNRFLHWVRFLCTAPKTTPEKIILFHSLCAAHSHAQQNLSRWLGSLEPNFFCIVKRWCYS